MNHWLVKSDPDDYSASDLERDKTTQWSGVRNAVAQRHLRTMKTGDAVLIYHTGAEKAIVAGGKVARGAYPDPDDADGKLCVIDLSFERWFARPVTLTEIKAHPSLASFDLVRISRLSVMPVNDEQWRTLTQMAKTQETGR